jgi:hypothetical protein
VRTRAPGAVIGWRRRPTPNATTIFPYGIYLIGASRRSLRRYTVGWSRVLETGASSLEAPPLSRLWPITLPLSRSLAFMVVTVASMLMVAHLFR